MKVEELFITEANSKSEIIVFGENHFKFDEVSRIRQAIVDFNPDVIAHELFWEEESYFKQRLSDTKVVPLEKEVGTFVDMKSQFKSRERSMISHLNRYHKKYSRIAVVVGDTHLRTIETEELGKKSPIMEWAKRVGAKVFRSNYKEIK